MAERYIIFRLVLGAGSRQRREFLYGEADGEGDGEWEWGPLKTKALRGTLRKMRALAGGLKGDFPNLIIERL
jgi:hypothetical protein